MASLGELELRRDAPAEARAWLDQALTSIEAVHGTDHPDLLRPLADLSLAAERQGDGAAAIAYARRRLALSIAAHGARSGLTLYAHLRLIELIGDFGEDSDAMDEFERLRPLLLDPAECDPADAVGLMFGAGRFLLRAGHAQDALPYLRRQVTLATDAKNADPRPPARLANAWAWLVIGGHRAGSADDARAAYLALATLEAAMPDSGDAQRFSELASLARWFAGQDDSDAFADLHRHARERLGTAMLPAAEDLLERFDD
jgi:tetratricopeptide (TPR) repeat protein